MFKYKLEIKYENDEIIILENGQKINYKEWLWRILGTSTSTSIPDNYTHTLKRSEE